MSFLLLSRFLFPSLSVGCLILALLSVPCAGAQVLQLRNDDSDPKANLVELTGELVELKKYSFSLQTGQGRHEVRVPRNTPISLVLNRPRFDLENRCVWVEPAESSGVSGEGEDEVQPDGEPPRMVRFPLPDPLYVTTRFAHAAQMNRILDQPVVRLNQYTLLAANPGYQYPSEEEEILILVGKVEAGAEPGKAVLVVDERRRELVLGHRGATLEGLTLANLEPRQVRLRVRGVLMDDQVLEAREIRVLPLPMADRDQPNRP